MKAFHQMAQAFDYIYHEEDESEFFPFVYAGRHQFLRTRGTQRFLTIGEVRHYFELLLSDIALAEQAERLDYLFQENAEDFSLLYYGPRTDLLERGEIVRSSKGELGRYLEQVKRDLAQR